MKTLLLLTLSAFSLILANAQTFSSVVKAVASDREFGDLFGYAVSISGDHAIVGAYLEDEDTIGGGTIFDPGSAYLFERDSNATWRQVQKVVASDRAVADLFGYSVSISSDYAIVGAYMEDEDSSGGNSMTDAGSAYVFERDGSGNWNQVAKLVASDRASVDFFGYSVSISGNHAIVGAWLEDQDTTGGIGLGEAGSAYLFERDGSGNWNEVQKIVASDREGRDWFGLSVSVHGDYAIVGAVQEDHDPAGGDQISTAGSAYIFERDTGGTWTEVQKIVASDRAAGDRFGLVSISGDYAIIGAYAESDSSPGGLADSSGSAYIFERDASGKWNEVQKIVASDRAGGDLFGRSVSISGNHALVGAFQEDQDALGAFSKHNAGSAYLFERDVSGNWNQVQKIAAPDRDTDDHFGEAVSISGNYAIVGASLEDHDATGEGFRNKAGSVYFFGPIEVGILEKDLGLSLSIYPNPSRGRVRINLEGSYSEVGVAVINLLGQTILSRQFGSTQQLLIEINGPSGFYLLEIRTGEGRVARVKVVKE